MKNNLEIYMNLTCSNAVYRHWHPKVVEYVGYEYRYTHPYPTQYPTFLERHCLAIN